MPKVTVLVFSVRFCVMGHWGRESGIISCVDGMKEVKGFNQTRHIDPGQETRTIEMDTMRLLTDGYTNDLTTSYLVSHMIFFVCFHH